MKILILGSKGNLGEEFGRVYHDHNPILWDRNELDITDEPVVMKKIIEARPDLVINCAAYSEVDKAEDEGRLIAETINGFAPGFIAAACNEIGATFVHFSSGQVFDGKKSEGYNEDDLPNPANAYGKSKLIGEIEVLKKSNKAYIVRTEWLYGGSNPDASVGVPTPAGAGRRKKSFVDIMLNLSAEGKEIKAVADEFGKPTFVKDLAQAVAVLVEQKPPFGIYHITNSGVASRFDWAKEIFTIKKIKANLEPVQSTDFARKAKRPKFEVLNNAKFIELRPWTEALKEYLAMY